MGMGHGVAEGFGEGQTDPAAQLGIVGVSLDESVDAVTRARTGLGGRWNATLRVGTRQGIGSWATTRVSARCASWPATPCLVTMTCRSVPAMVPSPAARTARPRSAAGRRDELVVDR